MPNKIIKDGAIVENQWQLVDTDATEVPNGPIIVPLSLWNNQQEKLAGRTPLGVWLNSDEPPENIADCLEHFSLIAINFPIFTDGRGFSYARELREVHHYRGEIRAIGNFIRDQLFFLKRCGFNAFELSTMDIESALKSFNDFSNCYQAAIDQPEPLFRRR
jgi:uncharacterized protein (DUF934 family)